MPSNYKTVVNFRDGIQVDTDDLISNNGLVGIGSTIPRQQLDVRGNIIVDENTELNNLKVTGVQTNYGTLNVAVGSSVGIGTTVPEEAFQVGVGTTGMTVSIGGHIKATKFEGDGSLLTGIPASVWVNPGAGNTIYSQKLVGIGTTLTRGNAGFGVGYEIYMDPVAGVGTFEGIVTKNLTVTNTTGAGQGNVNADVGTFSTITATSSISAPSFIGTITDAITAVVATGLTDSPNVDVNYITGVGGTFTGITSFSTLQISGGVVANGGIITATTFAGTASTAVGAQTAYSILGDPIIQVEQLVTTGLAPSIIKGSGVSTIGQDLLVGEFLGVGITESAAGDAAGFIGTVRIHDGDLKLGGSISIGGSLVGSINLGGEQTINVLNVGAGLSVAGVTTMTGNITGGGDFDITGNMTALEINSTDSIVAGGGVTCGSGLVVGATVAGSAIQVINGGGLIVGSGITMSGPIDGATNLVMNGPISGATNIAANGQITGITTLSGTGNWQTSGGITGDQGTFTNLNVNGISTLGASNVSNLTVGGDLNVQGVGTITMGNIKVDGVTGVGSFSAVYAPTGLSTISNLRVTDGSNTYMYGRYIGINTGGAGGGTSPGISEGLEIWEDGELFMHNSSKGVGIGSSATDRVDATLLHVGYNRDTSGNLLESQSIFESAVGIGTTTTRLSANNERFEIYKHTVFWNNHTGVGGTIGVGNTTTIRIGINSGEPGGSLDMRYSGEAFCLPRSYLPGGGVSGNPAVVDVNDNDYEGSMWYDGVAKLVRYRTDNSDVIGLTSTLDYDFLEERGYKGRVMRTQVSGSYEKYRESDPSANGVAPVNPPEAPVGWSTSNQCFAHHSDNGLNVNQLQIYGGDSIWRSLVGSAYTGVQIDIDTLSTPKKISFNVAGIGSATLNLT